MLEVDSLSRRRSDTRSTTLFPWQASMHTAETKKRARADSLLWVKKRKPLIILTCCLGSLLLYSFRSERCDVATQYTILIYRPEDFSQFYWPGYVQERFTLSFDKCPVQCKWYTCCCSSDSPLPLLRSSSLVLNFFFDSLGQQIKRIIALAED